MDVVESLRAFRAVALEQSFTRGAERCGVPQPVISRRVAALERQLGATLLERTSRSVSVTELGQRVLPYATELLTQWERIEATARGEAAPLMIMLPPRLDPRVLASIRRGLSRVPVSFAEGVPEERSLAWQDGRTDIALLVAAPTPGNIDVPLGLGIDDDAERSGGFSLARLRRQVRERDRRPRVMHLQDEDDTPSVRDPLLRLAQAHGLRRDQLQLSLSHTEVLTRVYEHGDVIVCTAGEAGVAGLTWVPIRGIDLIRSYQLVHRPGLLSDDEGQNLHSRLTRAVEGRR